MHFVVLKDISCCENRKGLLQGEMGAEEGEWVEKTSQWRQE